jgi:hypothetical protein
MRKQDTLFVALAAGTIAFVVGLAYPAFAPASVAYYYPLDHRWAFEPKPHGIAIDFYGRLLQATIAWAVVVSVTLLIVRRVRVIGQRALFWLGASALTATMIVIVFYNWTLPDRVLVPLAPPSWYQPR